MARKTRLTPYSEQIVEAFDESGSEFASFCSTPSMATKDGFPPDEPIPLFFSDHAEEPEPLDIGKAWNRAVISSRNLKASILAVTAATIVSRFYRWEIQSHSLRAPRHRWLAYRRLSLATVSRRQQFNQPPALRLCSRPQETRRRATKLLPLLKLPIRPRPKSVSHQPKPRSSNSRLGRPSKMPQHRSGPCKSSGRRVAPIADPTLGYGRHK